MFSNSDTVNKEEINISNISIYKTWCNSNLHLVPRDQIFKQSTFSKLSFLSNCTSKTIERTYSIKQDFETLFSSDSIEKYKKNFSFIHIGLV